MTSHECGATLKCFNIIQLLTGFEDNSSFVWPEDGSVARSRRPVYNCFVIHHFFLIIHFFHSHLFIRCLKYPRSSSPRIGTTFWHCDVNITWLKEPMKIRPSVNSSIAGNRSTNCWPVNRTVCIYNRDFVVNSQNVVHLLYCF